MGAFSGWAQDQMKSPILAVKPETAVVIAIHKDGKVSVEAKDVPAVKLVKSLSERLGMEIALIGQDERLATVSIKEMPLPLALDRIASTLPATWEKGYRLVAKTDFASPETFASLRKVSLDIQDVGVKTATKFISKVSGIKITVADEVQGRITLTGREMPLAEVFQKVAEQAGGQWKPVYTITLKPLEVAKADKSKDKKKIKLRSDGNKEETSEEEPIDPQKMMDPETWAKMSPEEAQAMMHDAMSQLFSLPRDQRQQIIAGIAQFWESRIQGLGNDPASRAQFMQTYGPMLNAGQQAFMNLPPDQQREFQPIVDIFIRLFGDGN